MIIIVISRTLIYLFSREVGLYISVAYSIFRVDDIAYLGNTRSSKWTQYVPMKHLWNLSDYTASHPRNIVLSFCVSYFRAQSAASNGDRWIGKDLKGSRCAIIHILVLPSKHLFGEQRSTEYLNPDSNWASSGYKYTALPRGSTFHIYHCENLKSSVLI
jgi:hypothetical protein